MSAAHRTGSRPIMTASPLIFGFAAALARPLDPAARRTPDRGADERRRLPLAIADRMPHYSYRTKERNQRLPVEPWRFDASGLICLTNAPAIGGDPVWSPFP